MLYTMETEGKSAKKFGVHPLLFYLYLSEFPIFLFVYLRVVSLEPCGKMCFSTDLILFHLANTIFYIMFLIKQASAAIYFLFLKGHRALKINIIQKERH